MRTIVIMAVKDLVLMTRDLLGLFFIVAFPILMGLFFGSMYSGIGQRDSSGMSIAVVDNDRSETSKNFVAALDAAEGTSVLPLTREQATNQVRRGDLVGMIVIPEGFGETAGRPWRSSPLIELGLDPSRQAEGAMLNGLVMQSYGQVIMERWEPLLAPLKLILQASERASQTVGATTGTKTAQSDSPSASADFQLVRIQTIDVTHEPEPGSREALVAKVRSKWDISFPQAMLWGVLACAATIAVSVVRERKQGTLLRLTAAPITRVQIVLGKALACFLAVLLVISMMTALGICLGMRPRSPELLILASLCIATAFVGISMLMSVIGRTEEAVGGAAWGANTIMAMFGGSMIPLAFMPSVMRPLSQASPVKWSILALEGAIWRGFTLAEMFLPCAILVAIGAVCLMLGAVRLSKMND